MLSRNQLVIRTDEIGGQLDRAMRVERVVDEPDSARPICVARAVVLDRITPMPPTAVDFYRPATPAEISRTERLGLLPSEIEDA
jgi:hypothetical protein